MAKDTGRHTLVRTRTGNQGRKGSARGSNDTGYMGDTDSKSIESFQENNNNTVKIEESDKNNIFEKQPKKSLKNNLEVDCKRERVPRVRSLTHSYAPDFAVGPSYAPDFEPDFEPDYSDESALLNDKPPSASRRTEPMYKGGVFHIMNQIKKDNDGIAALYQGLGISLVGAFMYVGLKLGLVEFFDVSLVQEENMSKAKYYFYVAILSWACSAVSGFMCYPIETIRRKMMVEKFDSWYTCYKRICEEGKDVHGYRYTAFFNGCVSNIILSIASMMIITLYKIMKDQIFQHCI